MDRTKRSATSRKALRVRIGAAAVIALLAIGGIGVAGFGLPGMAHRGPPQKDMAVDAAQRRQLVDRVVDVMAQHYVDPGQAALLAEQLRLRAGRGDFDRISSADQLADTLTDVMQAVLHDKHLEMRYFEQPLPEQDLPEDTPEDAARQRIEQQRLNFGFETVGRLKGDIGYLDLHSFQRPDQVPERLAAAMTLLAETHALIIDLRRNHGGDPETVMLLASYLFDQPTHLNDIWLREGDRTEARWTSAEVPGPRYGQARPIVVLTSEDTFSAGEDLAYALKYAGRATVIGEQTGGGAHPGDRHRLTAHFMMNVPAGRTINPVTHTDWEGIGVTPDVRVSARKALEVAQVRLLKQMIAAEPDPDWKRRLRDTLADLE